jgi:3-deoxy-D-manno-octulosonic-acid transferase
MSILYDLSIRIYYLGAFIFSFFNKKAHKWVKGQKDIFQILKNESFENCKTAWFHAASLGEFEQGRPVIESFKKKYPDYKIIISFFSPSGYEVRKNYKNADVICYLPIDTYANAKRFIHIVKPDVVFFIKYEFWFNYLKILYTNKIPTFLISGIFRENQHFFKIYGFWFRKQLNHFNHFFVQNEASKSLLSSIGFENTTISGDTRFDRVSQIAENPKEFPLIRKFKDGRKILLIGSSWQSDEEMVFDFIRKSNNEVKFIFAPHEVHEERIKHLKLLLPSNTVLFSDLNEDNCNEANILIINNIGILSHLYQYADIALIGGGFGKGIHNILEAATFGVPTIFGPNYQKFSEARELIQLKGAFTFNNKIDFENLTLDLLSSDRHYIKTKQICLNYIENKKGATEIILNNIKI